MTRTKTSLNALHCSLSEEENKSANGDVQKLMSVLCLENPVCFRFGVQLRMVVRDPEMMRWQFLNYVLPEVT